MFSISMILLFIQLCRFSLGFFCCRTHNYEPPNGFGLASKWKCYRYAAKACDFSLFGAYRCFFVVSEFGFLLSAAAATLISSFMAGGRDPQLQLKELQNVSCSAARRALRGIGNRNTGATKLSTFREYYSICMTTTRRRQVYFRSLQNLFKQLADFQLFNTQSLPLFH